MADNFISYYRFTALPPNISNYGTTVEEVGLQTGEPDLNPIHSPMAAPAGAELRLALRAAGSDRGRLSAPLGPGPNPYEGAKPAFFRSREAVVKLGATVSSTLQAHIEGGGVTDPRLSSMMLDSLARVQRLREYLTQINTTTALIYMRMVAATSA